MTSPTVLLKCTVCTKGFQNPCSLSCFHTFCRRCVASFAKTQPEATSVQSLSCPFCHQLTKVPDPNRPVEEWASQIPLSCVMESLLESDEREDSNTVVLCDLCKEEGELIDASVRCRICDVTLCDGCLKAHRRNPASRHHDIVSVSEETIKKEKRKLTCQDHDSELIQSYCKDCKMFLCQSCCKNCHKNCKNIISLDLLMPEIKTSLQDNKDVLTAIITNQNSKVSELKTKLDHLNSVKLSYQSQITTTFQNISQIIKGKEEMLLGELEKVTGKSLRKLEADVKEAEMSLQISQQKSDLIDHVLKTQNETHLFETFLSCEAGVVQLVDGLFTEADNVEMLTNIELIQDIDKLTKAAEALDFGQFDVSYFCQSTPSHLEVVTVSEKPTRLKVIGDECQASPTDVLVMSVSGETVLVVCDWGTNRSVKSFYNTADRTCHSRLSLHGGPYSLTKLGQNEVAVTVPDCKQIVTLEVNPNLKLVTTITTKKEYWSVTALPPSRLAVGAQSPSCVDILDMTGTVLRTLRPHDANGLIIKYPNFLSTTQKGNILVSDCGTKSVLCLTSEGDVIFKYTPTGDQAVKNLRGITTTNKGDILVADFSLHNIIHLTESGSFIRNIVTEESIQYPHGLYVDELNTIYASSYSEGLVRVFTCASK